MVDITLSVVHLSTAGWWYGRVGMVAACPITEPVECSRAETQLLMMSL
jgi:hypothetical protein